MIGQTRWNRVPRGGAPRGMAILVGVALAAAAGGLTPPSLVAQTPAGPQATSPEALEAAETAEKRLRSPFCPGLMLEVCPTPDAAALRDTLAAWASTGVSADSLVAMVVAQYGEEYRGFPQTRGRGLLAWLVPPLMLLLGLAGVVVALRRLRGSSSGPEAPVTDEETRRLEEALKELKDAEGTLF